MSTAQSPTKRSGQLLAFRDSYLLLGLDNPRSPDRFLEELLWHPRDSACQGYDYDSCPQSDDDRVSFHARRAGMVHP